MLLEHRGKRIAVEIERTAKRIDNDLMKAMSVNATELWIVVTSQKLAEHVLRRLEDVRVRRSDGVYVLTLEQARQRLRALLSNIKPSFYDTGKKN